MILGDGASVGANCVLKDTTVEAGARILPFCHIDGARIGPDARIGPYARMRPGADLAAHTHVGNFVEIKNAQLGEGSKANHLSYLGDATIGRNVNIGAGTIICNYDGAPFRPYRGRSIGLHTQLVARSPWARCGNRRQHDRHDAPPGRADRVPRQAGHGQGLKRPSSVKVREQLIVDRSVACLADDRIHALSFRTTDN